VKLLAKYLRRGSSVIDKCGRRFRSPINQSSDLENYPGNDWEGIVIDLYDIGRVDITAMVVKPASIEKYKELMKNITADLYGPDLAQQIYGELESMIRAGTKTEMSKQNGYIILIQNRKDWDWYAGAYTFSFTPE
jgi:hypothetical protein